MKFSFSSVATFCVLAATTTPSCFQSAEAFAGLSQSATPASLRKTAFAPTANIQAAKFSATTRAAVAVSSFRRGPLTQLNMGYTVGIVGAKGAVGKEIRQCLEKRNFPVEKLRIFGSERSAGSDLETEKYGTLKVELFDVDAARQCDVVFLAVDGDFALKYAKALSEGEDGCVVIDNSVSLLKRKEGGKQSVSIRVIGCNIKSFVSYYSFNVSSYFSQSAFRYDKDIPLVVPEINGKETKKSKLIANPNCTTAIGLMAIWPLIQKFGCKRVIMSTYQAASGAGQPGMDELQEGTKAYLSGETPKNSIFAYPLPFNVIPQIDKFQDNGYTKEEMKVTWETRKICSLPDDFPISCSAVRIPTIRAHSEVIIMETEQPVDVQAAREALAAAPGVKVVDNPDKLEYPMPTTATGQYDVEVGRLRKSLVFGDYGLEFFVSGDQLLRGAALNAVLVGEEMVQNGALKEKSKA